MSLFSEGYEDMVRYKLGVDEIQLPNEIIQRPAFIRVAELRVKERMPNYASIQDEEVLFILEQAGIAYLCASLVTNFIISRNIEVTTLDLKWKKDRVDWAELRRMFLDEFEEFMQLAEDESGITRDSDLLAIAKRTREPIGS